MGVMASGDGKVMVTSERILTITFATLFCLLERLYLPETSYDI
ncbi:MULTISPECIES: hypothetical protein [Bacteroides]|uniref:Uncharacterized protein n=1 Tax=Bacteroides faecis TaxID=674529 RepID=A0AAW5NZ75_9BACE|nr:MULTISPECIES: hypothetical protein [Bacteroides]MCS2793533.1 hypothetical protein [Bacteroides faecis]MCS3304526.1 hypothetical protein [Bacteroides faecis]MDC7151757.1 hypothetical protein [Bacteroides faecis]MDR3818562.1 hypothetical protein [Bacteroides sp.]MDU6153281.1 hypothetical protein [Bacteroides faecis]